MWITYEPTQYEIPGEGIKPGTLIDIRDLGIVTSAFGSRPCLLFTWQILNETDSLGRPLRVFQRITRSLHPLSALSQVIFEITGSAPGNKYETDDLLGATCNLTLEHRTGADGRVFCNVIKIQRSTNHGGEAQPGTHNDEDPEAPF